VKRIIIAVILSLLALPALAADRFVDLTGWAVWVDTNSEGTFDSANANQPFDVSFDGKLGYGAGVNVFFSDRLSVEVMAAAVKQGISFAGRTRPAGASGGDLNMVPITGVLQFHLIPNGTIDPYIGAGAAYVLFDDVDDPSEFGNLNVRSIDFKDDVGLALNAGISFAITPRFAITVDGKYVPLKSSAKAVFVTGPDTTTKIDINPVIFSAGLSLRF